MKIIRGPFILLCAMMLLLLAVAVPPWGVCIHKDGTCAEGRDCCRTHQDEQGDDCDTCSDHTPSPSLTQERGRFDLDDHQLAGALPVTTVEPVTACMAADGVRAPVYRPASTRRAFTPLRC